jgi:hypothetical protein
MLLGGCHLHEVRSVHTERHPTLGFLASLALFGDLLKIDYFVE